MHAEESALWSLDRKDGMEKAYCCFNSNARDFARFGQLLLNNGQWDGQQLISPAYLAEATSPDTRLVYKDLGKPNHCYGFQYWILDYKGMKIPYMRGILGQYVFTLPEKNAVIVRLGHKRSDTYTADQHYPDDINTWLDAAMDLLQ
jgi:CubicO group peptidase (beta-lactamase class C family)